MAKKKKTQLKPVVRGFATTSVPKKVAVEEEASAPPPTIDPSVSEQVEVQKTEVAQDGNGEPIASPRQPEGEPDKVQQAILQSLVDKLQEKTEKDILRTIKMIEVERRFANTLPHLDLDVTWVDRILDLILDSQPGEDQKAMEDNEEKAMAKLGVTYGVLRRLGFSDERVVDCLRSIGGVDLDEAYDWLYIHCTTDELDEIANKKHVGDGSEPRTPQTPRAPRTPRTPRTPAQFMVTPTPLPAPKSAGLDPRAPAFIPSSSIFEPNNRDDWSDQEQSTLKSRFLSSFDRNSRECESGSTSSDIDDPNSEYVRLKLLITSLRSHPSGRANASIQRYEKRLEVIKKDYLFDEQDAELQYQAERALVEKATLLSKLRGDPVTSDTSSLAERKIKRPPNLLPQPVSERTSTPDIFDDDDSDSAGGLFEILQEVPVTETDAKGMVIRIRDMPIPKHWSGRTPKLLLSETVAKSDRYAVISYQIISGSSRAKRASVCIRWEGQKVDEWKMEDVACHEEIQAEQYIATVGLFSLTYPPTVGFAGSSLSISGSQTFFRLLPAVFRDLWDELVTTRKQVDDATNRAVWAMLRSIVGPKLELNNKNVGKLLKTVQNNKNGIMHQSIQHSDLSPAQIIAGFNARRSSQGYQDMLQQRNSLPIAKHRAEILSALERSQILVLSGETGCGKSTQVPSYILEDQLSKGKHCKIYCTEPRRISAISLAQRVSRELGDPAESVTSRNTRLTFVTNGIALRMLERGSGPGGQGMAFDEITHIIIDEVHERSIESDFLLIVINSLIKERTDLKVVLMSATVDAEKISNYFGDCPILHIPGRTFPVEVRFLEDALEYTQWSISENSVYARRSQDKYYRNKNRTDWAEELTIAEEEEEEVQAMIKLGKRYSANTAATINLLDERLIPYDLILRLLERICFEDPAHASYSAAILIFMPGLGEIRRMNDVLMEHPLFGSVDDFKIYPLHSTLSSENQSAVFDIPPQGTRKIVIATNIAETGITIPDITCVIDTGKHREMRFDEKRQISRLVETFIAKSNAAQRRGRAGRVQRGLCFHLFTKLRHDTQMAEHPLPEMMRLSLSDLALRIKIMKVKLGTSIEDVLSRALDPPAPINIQRAISSLVEVRALTSDEEITPMGRLLSKLPTDVHLGKFLLIAALFRCLDPALTIAAALNSKSPFVTPLGLEEEADRAKSVFRVENSDFLTIHNAFSSWRRACANTGFVRKFCRTNFLSHQNLQQIEEIRQQYLGYLVDSSFIHADKNFAREISRARYGRNRTRFVSVPPEWDKNSDNFALINAALTAGLYPKILSIDSSTGQLRTSNNNQLVAFHPSSVNFRRKPSDFGVNHLSYFTLMHSKKLYAWETGPVDDVSLMLLCGEADFKLISVSGSIDRKIRFRMTPKAIIALKYLRSQLHSVLSCQFRRKVLIESQILWNQAALMVLGKEKIAEDENLVNIVVG